MDFAAMYESNIINIVLISVYSPGPDIIGYKDGGTRVTARYLPAASVTDPENGVDWSSATVSPSYEWAIGARAGTPSDPVFSGSSTASVSDIAAVSTLVLQITFTDADVGDTVAITMPTDTYFDLVDNGDDTADITVKASLVGESGTKTVTVTGTDDCGHTTTQNIVITVTNTPPQITNLVASVTTSEDVPTEILITTYTCSDNSLVSSASITETPANSPPFFITKLTGGATDEYGIYVRSQANTANGVFNYNTQMSYVVTVTCDDNIETVTDTITVYPSHRIRHQLSTTFHVNFVLLKYTTGTTVNVSVNAVNGSVIFTADLTDADGDTINASITTFPTPSPFQILDSGQILVIGSLADYVHTGYDIFVHVQDAKNAGVSRTLSVVVVDINTPPEFTNMDNTITVDEGTASGVSLFTVMTTDIDADSLTLSWAELTSGTAYFDLNSTTGIVTTSTLIDYEAIIADGSSSLPFIFEVVLSDGQASATSTLTVSINNLNEQLNFSSSVYRADVVEWTAVGTTLVDPGFSIIDADTTDTYVYTMDCGTTYNGYFQMGTDNTITVTSLYKLDNGLPITVTCSVTAVDSGGNSDTTSLIITISYDNNFTPTFSNTNYVFAVDPAAVADTSIGTVAATDDDLVSYATFSYSLDQTALNATYFKIDGSSGEISTLVSMSTCACSGSTFSFPVLATDTGGLVGTSTVHITVTQTTTTAPFTDRYKTFFDDTRNLVWFSILMILLAVTLIVTLFVCMKYICMSPTNCKMPCTGGSRRYNGRPRYERGYSPPRQEVRQRPRKAELVSVRRPPGDKHHWQYDQARF
ncbi:protocadherin-like wing polarity protein stan [Ruditapes philippinarum]|uniref:protocadherin-like wing polarity protein stan n=1 Tax=Ruditapes philippinarum TaxID=129788 RepID=UPI00295B3572|nr:protocadherin-like wing polarity protein stan [Ruditapes philippinarum]